MTVQHLPPPDEPPFDPDYDAPAKSDTTAAREAERALLGTLLTSPERAAEILSTIDPRDFASPAHEAIWNAARALLTEDTVPDQIAIFHKLEGDRTFTRAGGHNLLLQLRFEAPALPQAALHAQIVRDGAALRRFDSALANIQNARATVDPTRIRSTLEKLSDLVDAAATDFGPTTGPASGLHDLSWILTGQPPISDPPTYAHRDDGHALFYAGKVNGIFGDPESGKTWLAQAAIVEALNGGGTAAMIDVDHNGPDHTAARLALLGARWEDIANPDRFRYYEPEEPAELLAAVDDITTRRSDVYVLDSLGEVLPMLGVKSVDNDEITSALRRTCTPPASAGCCVITIDHLPKSAEARVTGYAIGGTAKKRIMRGSYIRVETRTQPAPGQIGRATLRIEKDTIGELRKVTPGGYAGTLVLDSSQEHITRWSIERESVPHTPDGKPRRTILMEAVSRFVEQTDQCTQNTIEKAKLGKVQYVREAIASLIEEGFLTTLDGPRGSTLHHSVAMYRRDEDDNA